MRRDGNPAERCVVAVLREAGYLVASRRHEPGPGDHLAIARPEHGVGRPMPLLIETKGGASAGQPWKDFERADREAMIETALAYHAIPLLAWVLSTRRGEICWLPLEDWPA